ncbi:MAG: cytidine deaminase [Bacteroidetes bacterium]|jgi:homotetrameric cytidine deaminase|nr:cytidine deaminase [Bacteroidota bacterium]
MNINQLKTYCYSPYSSYKEDCCLLVGVSGTIYPGVRVENISFPLTITPLHGAICSCLANNDQPAAYFSNAASGELESYWENQYKIERLADVPDPAAGSFFSPFAEEITDPVKTLKDLIPLAVTSHSDFPVSALLYSEKGIVTGVNVEVTSWSLGLCAERVAIFRAISAGARNFKKMAIYAPNGDFNSPCGACRQVLVEWMPSAQMELHHGDHSWSTHETVHLLPFAFSSSKLDK